MMPAPKLAPHARLTWIEKYLREQDPCVDVLNRDFVEAYVEATGAPYQPSVWGAGWCDMLGRDLKALYDLGRARRGRVGLGMNWQPGFPKWVYTYELENRDANG